LKKHETPRSGTIKGKDLGKKTQGCRFEGGEARGIRWCRESEVVVMNEEVGGDGHYGGEWLSRRGAEKVARARVRGPTKGEQSRQNWAQRKTMSGWRNRKKK